MSFMPGDMPCIDLFAGAGGLSLGLEAAGFQPVEAVELDADAASTYRMHHPDTKVHEQDIGTLDFRRLAGNVALVAGGPPCQPWSIGGLRQFHDDKRDGIPQFARALWEIAPPLFIMENVAGLASGSARSHLTGVIEVLAGRLPLSTLLGTAVPQSASLPYTVEWRVLNAADHGLPQIRRRLVVVGRHSALGFGWPRRTHGTPSRGYRPAGAVIGPEPVGELNRAVVTYAKRPSIRPDPYHGQVYNGGGRPIDLRRPSPTLLASMGGNKTPWVDTAGVVPEYHAHLRSGGAPRSGLVPGARRITVQEAALIQTFDPSAVWAGTRSSQYRQIGNAVPPRLAEVVGRRLLAALSTTASSGSDV